MHVSAIKNTWSLVTKGLPLPRSVKIVEVAPRDGLQNVKQFVDTNKKLELIRMLVGANLTTIEATSFVSPKAIPQFVDASKVVQALPKDTSVKFPVLVPNAEGMRRAIENNVKTVAVFTAASEGFSKANMNCSVEESLRRVDEVTKLAASNKIAVRGYVSCVVECPYNGKTDPFLVKELTLCLLERGCYEVSLGDTIGVGTVGIISKLFDTLSKNVPMDRLAVHFHDTFGQALTNVLCSLSVTHPYGITTVDSAIGGLGGCPFARGKASGNLSTEDLVYMLHGLGVETGVKLDKLFSVSQFIANQLPYVTIQSKSALAMSNRRKQ